MGFADSICQIQLYMRLVALQVDPKDAQTAALKREVQLLRAENAYLRGQLSSTALSGKSATQTNLPRSGSALLAMPAQPQNAASKQAHAEVGCFLVPTTQDYRLERSCCK